MRDIEKLKKISTLKELAELLQYSPKGFSYVAYKLRNEEKYRTFQIPKSYGGSREIKAPHEKLKRLQLRIAKLLSSCYEDIHRGKPPLSHGFRKKHSIVTNAYIHRNRRYIFNIDLKNFFPSINFGRVRGYFIKSKDFTLQEKVATVIAQVSCHDNKLPQGAPTSPVISNLIGHILDVKMTRLAKQAKCTYSRYADDITFSTNKKSFPEIVAFKEDGVWFPGHKLKKEIAKSGFEINPDKTSMQYKTNRQAVTSLVVNKKVNIRRSYYKTVRAMCNRLLKKGSYCVKGSIKKGKYMRTPPDILENTDVLHGHLSYIHSVKNLNEEDHPSMLRLYRDFLFFDMFYRNDQPLIVCEGKTDAIYFKCALKSLSKYYQNLINFEDDKYHYKIKFFNHSTRIKKIFNIANGVGGVAGKLPNEYNKSTKKFMSCNPMYPIVVILDNDNKARQVINNSSKNKIWGEIDDLDDTYFIEPNLYVTMIPPLENRKETIIEDYFPEEVLKREYRGRKFILIDNDNGYDKNTFAEKIIKPMAKKNEKDFLQFKEILGKIERILDIYQNKKT